ncbi:hypothetical protein [Actinoallomurus sp. CA-150999]|uniref:hypothetical protein n=1 Tax=Actinoallomurus sp. CA-150999 TaxID=3239887 RepID=UPI003D930A55
MSDGTIPFRQAGAALEAIHKMLKAAATTAANPDRSHQGRRPATVSDFLEEDVRLGHTKRGSFVFTVVSRLGDPPLTRPTAVTNDQQAGVFSRHVMETLALGLETTRDLAVGRRVDVPLEPSRWGLSAVLVESLEDLTQPEDIRTLDLSFEWAATERKPKVGREPIILEHAAVSALSRVRERLIRQEEPPRRVTLVGVVRSLSREDDTGEADSGAITIATEVNGRLRNVHMTLSAEDHEWAIRAYSAKIPLTVTGDLVFQRRSWRLQGRIELDTSFLKHHLGGSPR